MNAIPYRQFLANTTRRLQTMFPGFAFPGAKHNHNADFSWPDTLDFTMLHRMYCRNGLAHAGVNKTILKTWQTNPELLQSETPTENGIEVEIRKRFADLRLWQAFAEADRRAMVGGYAGLIIRYRDGLTFDKPVTTVRGGLDGIAEIIPVWAGQLTVGEWNSDVTSENYGKPKMFSFNEASVDAKAGANRAFNIHPDRVLIWSADGTVHSRSVLEPGYNDLLDAEKVKGAGGEGFYKTAAGRQVLEMDKETSLANMAAGAGLEPDAMAASISDQVNDFTSGFDKFLLLQGIIAKPLQISLPSPEHFFAAPVSSFAASIGIPVKILLGSQTGERASTEDAADWALTNTARREGQAKPLINQFVQRLEAAGIIPKADWLINWADLTDTTQEVKMQFAERMAKINQTALDPVFTGDEMRETVGMKPLTGVIEGGGEEE